MEPGILKNKSMARCKQVYREPEPKASAKEALAVKASKKACKKKKRADVKKLAKESPGSKEDPKLDDKSEDGSGCCSEVDSADEAVKDAKDAKDAD